MTSERERFEAWAAANGHGTIEDMMMPLDRSLRRLLWSAWQARAALPAPADQPTSQEAHTDHPLHHWDRTCPACNASIDYSDPSQEAREYPPFDEAACRAQCEICPWPDEEWPCAKKRADDMLDADRKARRQEAMDAESVALWLADHDLIEEAERARAAIAKGE